MLPLIDYPLDHMTTAALLLGVVAFLSLFLE